MPEFDAPWLLHVICGFEGDGDGGTGDTGSGSGSDSSGGTDGGTGDTGDAGDGGTDSSDDDLEGKDLAGLKEAIKKEREQAKAAEKRAKAAEKEANRLKQKDQESADKDKSEVEKAKTAQQRSEERLAKLAAGYKKSAVDRAIEREARKLNFTDPDDAISLVDRSGITVEQDEDDPADVEIDAKTVKAAVKALADKKKHLLGGSNSGDGDSSGSRFGGGQRSTGKQTEEDLKKKYPSLL